MPAKHFWTMTKEKIMEGVFGEYSLPNSGVELTLDSR
jgi:hypothetical protein